MRKSGELFIYHIGMVEDILGPGKRIAIWLSGCPFRCKGCIEEKLQDINRGKAVNIDELAALVQGGKMKSVPLTLSGGEPLFQSDALLKFFSRLEDRPEIMLFSGYKCGEYRRKFFRFNEYIDILVCGPYIEKLAGSFLWRGSSNQQIISPSGKYGAMQLEKWMQAKSAGIKIFLFDDTRFTYGIPTPGMLEKIGNKLMNSGVLEVENQTYNGFPPLKR